MSGNSRGKTGMSRREFLKAGLIGSSALAVAGGCSPVSSCLERVTEKPIVSIVRIPTDRRSCDEPIPSERIGEAVKRAVDLLGGFESVLDRKQKIMLKPNLVGDTSTCTTNREVVFWLAYFMQIAGKAVSIGEGSAVAAGANTSAGGACYTYDDDRLDQLQSRVFDFLHFDEINDWLETLRSARGFPAQRLLPVPLINLHVARDPDRIVEVDVPCGLAYSTLKIHSKLQEIDLLCSVPMMKTHHMASVSLGLKNLIGLYPGSQYGTVRSAVHEHAYCRGSKGVAFEILDMARVNKLGLTVIDATNAMEGTGPCGGKLVPMNMIIAGTNTLATDMVAAHVMGYSPDEVPTFVWAHRLGMQPQSLYDVDVRGESMFEARRIFERPELHTWPDERDTYSPCPGESPVPTECARLS